MKKHTINTKSWHYKFVARFIDVEGGYAPKDICGYRRKFINAFLKMLFIYALITIFVVLPIFDTAVWLAASISLGEFHFMALSEPTRYWWGIVTVLGLLIGGGYLYTEHQERKAAKRRLDERRGIVIPPKQPGTVALAYRSLKEKFCVQVDFE